MPISQVNLEALAEAFLTIDRHKTVTSLFYAQNNLLNMANMIV
jgi:hypothetical protein